jgi:hypothetical protein
MCGKINYRLKEGRKKQPKKFLKKVLKTVDKTQTPCYNKV